MDLVVFKSKKQKNKFEKYPVIKNFNFYKNVGLYVYQSTGTGLV